MRIALFGGTFDPIHSAHVRMARMLADRLALDRVLLMPASFPPHKIKSSDTKASDRLNMCRLAAAEDPRFEASDLELARGGASFTVDTLEQLHRLYPEAEWYLLIGADMFMSFGSWYRFEDILKLAVVCTVPRGEIAADALRRYAATLSADMTRFKILDTPVGDISSTEIRSKIAAGEPLDELVPPAVAAYIRAHNLYWEPVTMDLKKMEPQFIEIIRKREGDRRFLHSLEVAKEAERLSRRYGADPEKARAAGLLHDVMKDISPDEQLQIFKDFGILLDDVEKKTKKLWHARSGAVFLEKVLHIEDRDILNAVRYHTTGRAGMSLLEKVVFIADFTSADRDYDDVDVIRKLADESLESAMRYALEYTVQDLTRRGHVVHPNTLAALDEIKTGGDDHGG